MDNQVNLILEKKNLVNEIEKLKKEHSRLQKSNAKFEKDITALKIQKNKYDDLTDKIKNKKKELTQLNTSLEIKKQEYTDEKSKIYADALEEIKKDFENKKKKIQEEYKKKEKEYNLKIKDIDEKYKIEEQNLHLKLKNEEKKYRHSKRPAHKGVQCNVFYDLTEDISVSDMSNASTLKYEMSIQTEPVDFNVKYSAKKTEVKSCDDKLTCINRALMKSSIYLTKLNMNEEFDLKADKKLVFDKKISSFKIYSKLNRNLNLYVYNSKTTRTYLIYIIIRRVNGRHINNMFYVRYVNKNGKMETLGSFVDKTLHINNEYNIYFDFNHETNVGHIKFLNNVIIINDVDFYWLFTDNNSLKITANE